MKSRRIAAALVAAALVIPASAALAKPFVMPGWSPLTPPRDLPVFESNFPLVLYSVSCGGLTATGWSADVADDTAFKAAVVTTSAVASACMEAPESIVVRQGDDTVPALSRNSDPGSGVGLVVVVPDRTYVHWNSVPMPRIGQWVAIDARAADGSPLPMLQRRVTGVGADTFTVDSAIGPEYLGAPVVDNMARVLGTVASAGTLVGGTPRMCGMLFDCTDPDKVWWDITAPSAPRTVKATPGKRSVTVTWKPAASDGGAEVAYWYSVNGGAWIYADAFRATVKARPGASVTVAVQGINHAGPGPMVMVTAKAR